MYIAKAVRTILTLPFRLYSNLALNNFKDFFFPLLFFYNIIKRNGERLSRYDALARVSEMKTGEKQCVLFACK